MSKLKNAKQMERHLKGVANHHRIDILLAVSKNKGITFEEIVDKLKANEKTISAHTVRLVQAGLVDKRHRGKFVEHYLSPYGKKFADFLTSLQKL